MKRLSLICAGALACLALASVGTAAAMPTEGIVNTSCTTNSKNVIGKKVTIVVAGKNVDPTQMRYAECKVVQKVANKILSLRIEMPKIVEGFRCTPSVVKTSPDVVRYSCLFRGADTATEIRLKFTARYDLD